MKPEISADMIYGWLQGKQAYTKEALENLIKQIQLEHWKQGMTDAGETVMEQRGQIHDKKELVIAIERVRDARNTI